MAPKSQLTHADQSVESVEHNKSELGLEGTQLIITVTRVKKDVTVSESLRDSEKKFDEVTSKMRDIVFCS